jgi:hypothetical protein
LGGVDELGSGVVRGLRKIETSKRRKTSNDSIPQ